jgi:hypothetical protein
MRRDVLVIFAALLVGLPALAAAQGNLVVNGDFESGGASWTEWSSPGGWTTGVFAHDYASGVPIWNPAPYPYAGSGSHGQHVGTNNVHGGIYQVVNVQSGRAYDVSGVWSGGIGESGSQPFDVAWFEVTVYQGAVGAAEIDAAPGPNDVVIAKREYTGDSIISFGWEPFNGSFVAQQDQVTLAFKTGKVSPNWHPIAAFHDNVALQLAGGGIPTLAPTGALLFAIVMAAAGLMLLWRRSF